jgi:two-component system nitrate/nitrite response regulator NarL
VRTETYDGSGPDVARLEEGARGRADDHPLYREGVVRALSSSGQVDVVAQAEDGRSALTEIEHHQPDVALLDYKLPGLDGLAITHAVVRDGLPTRFC